MKKHMILFAALVMSAQMWGAGQPVTAPADIPNYWSSVNGKSGAALWDAVKAATNKNYSSIGYKGLYTAYLKTDVYPADSASKAGKIWDMYGECLFATSKTCGNYSGVCDCYNREHSIPQSWWGGGTGGIGNDIFHVLPTDGKVNGVRSNYEYGVVNGGTNWVGNKFGSAGSWSTDKKTIASEAGESVSGSGSVFEPKDQYKGDIARGLLGTIVKWEQSSLTSGNNFFNGVYTPSSYFGLTKKAVVLLMKWHREDPVSKKEIDRNNGIQATQGNRNPFIDYPYLAEYIWGEHAGEKVDMSKLMPSCDKDFVPGKSDGWREGGSVTPDPDPDPDPDPEPVYYTLYLSRNGHVTPVTGLSGTFTLPTDEADACEDWSFAGWADASVASTTTKPTFITSVNTDQTVYAVYSQTEESAGGSAVVTKLNMEDYKTPTGTFGAFTFAKGGTASTQPAYNTNNKDVRYYANGTLTISCAQKMSKIVFNLSAQGKSKLADISASNGTIATQAKGDTTVTWTGDAELVTFSVGAKATYGNKSTDAGQLCFSSVDITVGSGPSAVTTYMSQPDCPIPTYTVTWVYDDFDVPVTYDEGMELMLPSYVPANCTNGKQFIGWTDDIDDPESYFTEAEGIVLENTTYYAVYAKHIVEEPQEWQISMEKLGATSGTVDGISFEASQEKGASVPTYSATNKDLRCYANNTLTISSDDLIGKIVLTLSTQGKKRLAPITASSGTIATQAAGDETVTWTGMTTSVTFTVGDKADYGSDGSSKAGQLCISAAKITGMYTDRMGDFTIGCGGSGEPTNVENTETESQGWMKVLIDGHLYIIRGAQMYDITGRLVR